jgi:hypothetical protein
MGQRNCCWSYNVSNLTISYITLLCVIILALAVFSSSTVPADTFQSCLLLSCRYAVIAQTSSNRKRLLEDNLVQIATSFRANNVNSTAD